MLDERELKLHDANRGPPPERTYPVDVRSRASLVPPLPRLDRAGHVVVAGLIRRFVSHLFVQTPQKDDSHSRSRREEEEAETRIHMGCESTEPLVPRMSGGKAEDGYVMIRFEVRPLLAVVDASRHHNMCGDSDSLGPTARQRPNLSPVPVPVPVPVT